MQRWPSHLQRDPTPSDENALTLRASLWLALLAPDDVADEPEADANPVAFDVIVPLVSVRFVSMRYIGCGCWVERKTDVMGKRRTLGERRQRVVGLHIRLRDDHAHIDGGMSALKAALSLG